MAWADTSDDIRAAKMQLYDIESGQDQTYTYFSVSFLLRNQ